MTADYLFVSMTFTFITGMILMLLGLENREYPNAVIYHFFSAISFFFLSMLFLMGYASTTSVLPTWIYFFGFGCVNFVLFFFWLAQMFNVYRKKKSGMEEED